MFHVLRFTFLNSVVLIVLDGFGIAPPNFGNAIHLANPTNIHSFQHTYPNTTLRASGESVGLPVGEVGNTEVGHINLGAGRIVYQDLPRINMSIADGSFYNNPSLLKAVEHCKTNKSNLHIIGLIGEGSVHSNLDHLHALLFFAKENKCGPVYIHAITDGRDSPPRSSQETIKRFEEKIKQNNLGTIASIMGRYYAMDRDKRWDRIEKAYRCLTEGIGNKTKTADEAIAASYAADKTDEFIDPTNIVGINNEVVTIKEGDVVIFFNFRIDRPRQLTKAFVLENFEQDANQNTSFDPYAVKYLKSHLPSVENNIVTPPFKRGPKIDNLLFITMTEYEKNLPVEVAFPPIPVHMPVGRVIAEHGLDQLRMSESEKERFVTFYFNGQRENAFTGEERLIIPSPKVPTYDLQPEMSALELTNALLQKMREQKYRFILINFANADMVGHTGNIEATIRAIKTLDQCLHQIAHEALLLDYTVLITADHGNAEQKINPRTGQISTEHTDNPVPFIAINKDFQGKNMHLQSGILADVAPTILALMEIPKPDDMSGRNLLEEVK